MPVWLFGVITGLSFLTALCGKCQSFDPLHNKPARLVSVEEIRRQVRDTPVTVLGASDTTRFYPIPNAHEYYKLMYYAAVGCSGMKADSAFWETKFYVADHAAIKMDDSTWADGFYDHESKIIVMSLEAVWERKAVTHELLHMILWANKLEDSTTVDVHPALYFEEKCKGFVRPH